MPPFHSQPHSHRWSCSQGSHCSGTNLGFLFISVLHGCWSSHLTLAAVQTHETCLLCLVISSAVSNNGGYIAARHYRAADAQPVPCSLSAGPDAAGHQADAACAVLLHIHRTQPAILEALRTGNGALHPLHQPNQVTREAASHTDCTTQKAHGCRFAKAVTAALPQQHTAANAAQQLIAVLVTCQHHIQHRITECQCVLLQWP